MSLPLFSGRCATSDAAFAAAPDEMPTSRPSSSASLLAYATASSLLTCSKAPTQGPQQAHVLSMRALILCIGSRIHASLSMPMETISTETPPNSLLSHHARLYGLVQEICVQVARDEARADALDLVGAGRAAGNDRALGRLDGDELRPSHKQLTPRVKV